MSGPATHSDPGPRYEETASLLMKFGLYRRRIDAGRMIEFSMVCWRMDSTRSLLYQNRETLASTQGKTCTKDELATSSSVLTSREYERDCLVAKWGGQVWEWVKRFELV